MCIRDRELESEIRSSLEESVRLRISPESEEAKRIVLLHREWLGMTWKQYSPEAHKGLTQMYTADERFKSYYDKEVPGCAAFLAQAAACWADKC